MADLKEQHVCKKFCFKMGENATEVLKMLKVAFVGHARGTTQVFCQVQKQYDATFSRHPPWIKIDEYFDETSEGTCARKQRNCSSRSY